MSSVLTAYLTGTDDDPVLLRRSGVFCIMLATAVGAVGVVPPQCWVCEPTGRGDLLTLYTDGNGAQILVNSEIVLVFCYNRVYT